MKPAVTRLYAVLVVLTLVGLTAWAGTDWYQHRQKALSAAQSTLREAAGRVTDLTVRALPLDRHSLGAVFAAGPGAQPRWKVVLLESPDRGTEYYRGPRPAVDASSAIPRWEPKAFSEIGAQAKVFRAVGDPLTLSGIYEFYGRAEIFSLLQACGITLLVLLVLTSAMVILGAGRAPATDDRAPAPEPADQDEPAPGDAGLPDWEASLPDLDPGLAAAAPKADDDEYWFEEELTLEDLPPLQTPAAPAAVEPSVNPATGLGWEAGLSSRLTAELDRAAAESLDLSLVLLACKAGRPDEAAWGAAVKEAFGPSELLFDADGGAAVVLPGRSLEQALKAARAFVGTADQRWPSALVHAGAAARSGRQVPADTLLNEARSARRRTLAGTVRVLGLKTDPDRWREHLSSA